MPDFKLKKLGKVKHITRNHRAVIPHVSFLPPYEAVVVNEAAQEVGIIKNIFGPVADPYVSFQPYDHVQVKPGDTIFVKIQKKKTVKASYRASRKRKKRKRQNKSEN